MKLNRSMMVAAGAVAVTAGMAQADLTFNVSSDAYIQSDGTGDGSATKLLLKRDFDGSDYHRKVYLRFDLPADMAGAIDARSGRGLQAQLDLPFDDNSGSFDTSATWDFHVYGLTDETGDNWDGATIDYANAPGNAPADSSGNALDTSKTTSLGTFTGVGKAIGTHSVNTANLLNFIGSDTNQQLTAIVVRDTLPDYDGDNTTPSDTYVHAVASGGAQLHLTEFQNLLGSHGEFENTSGFTTDGWTISGANPASSHAGLISGSQHAAYLDSSTNGELRYNVGLTNSDWKADLYFATSDGNGSAGDRGFNAFFKFDGGQINVRVNGEGNIQVYNDQGSAGNGWQTIADLANIVEFSADGDETSGFDDLGDTLNVHRLKIVTHDWGTANANYDILLSLAGETEFSAAALGLTFFQSAVPSELAAAGFTELTFSTLHGTGDFAVDSVYVTGTSTVIPEPASLGLLAMAGLAIGWRPRRG